MSRLSVLRLLIIGAVAALVGFITTVYLSAHGMGSPVLPRTSLVTLLGIALIVLTLGLMVWRDQRRIATAAAKGRRSQRSLHPLHAVRVLTAGQAGAYAGALIAGWHAGILGDLVPAAALTAPNVNSSLLMITGGTIWVIIGFVVELLCRIPPDENPPGEGRRREPERNTGPIPEEGYARGTH
ncbi:DUF3180 domain-containing protein [Nesterenkonia sp. LB17]|uniref:DUF3180 domain-containing protein n=1 Tax=unclassified Nesterenkonia TaxID=2629769 RepID=UPI001F4D1F56|nr:MULTISPECIES: DUF3180 domain-containing protein [unclassified Nesterenkonia]MCH8561021.1 DUF3180 domain-containing protein [Nesterenkonia sp. DZ6]MCH8563369.1 DUF3180 domain-containing protein [Nesterenkonia sp. YGD6]MCH8566588.1 DUF3180 domain-containing protein [Nesterenkonia sp. LB17]MCH8571097.1 DUF3180 domain-containing protein [Nesterenkonia sp. AY15]